MDFQEDDLDIEDSSAAIWVLQCPYCLAAGRNFGGRTREIAVCTGDRVRMSCNGCGKFLEIEILSLKKPAINVA